MEWINNLKDNFNGLSRNQKIALIIGGVILCYFIVHFFSNNKTAHIPTPDVRIQEPVVKEMADYVTQTGTIVAFNSVNLVARIEGYLDAIEFVDGTYVKKGKELFVIQPEPYMEKLKAAQATVVARKADYAYSKSEYARQQRMYKENATSQNNVEIWLAKMEASEAEVHKAIAEEMLAEINYSYTHIAAPFDGRIGRHLVDVGNLVGNGIATDLATIEQIDKLYVYFNLNEIDLVKLRDAAHAEGMDEKKISQIPVYISLQDQPEKTYTATFDFVNTGLNASTGTMELRAILDNKDLLFVPGFFVKVKVAISPPAKRLTIPDTAILYDQIGSYILTVDDKNLVVLKRVQLGTLENGMRAIVQGLDSKDKVNILKKCMQKSKKTYQKRVVI